MVSLLIPVRAQIWFEDFNLREGTTDDPNSPSIWYRDISASTIVPPDDYFEVQSQAMSARDVGGEVVSWRSRCVSQRRWQGGVLSFVVV